MQKFVQLILARVQICTEQHNHDHRCHFGTNRSEMAIAIQDKVACATFCLKVKILKQVIIKWQRQWPRYTSSILRRAIAVYHQNARM